MKTKIAFILTALFSASTIAIDNTSSCNVNLSSNVKVTPAFVQVLDGDQSLYKITSDSKLYAQGQLVHLNSEQQAIVDEYRKSLQELAPEIAHLITQGLDIAKDALETVFTELFGDDADFQQKIETIINKFEQRIAPMMNDEKGEYYLSNELANQDTDALTKEIEEEVEKIVMESSGHLMMFIGKMLLQGEKGIKDLEQKMDDFGKSMNERGDKIEKNAEKMCGKMKALDELETKMQNKIPQISNFDLLDTQVI